MDRNPHEIVVGKMFIEEKKHICYQVIVATAQDWGMKCQDHKWLWPDVRVNIHINHNTQQENVSVLYDKKIKK